MSSLLGYESTGPMSHVYRQVKVCTDCGGQGCVCRVDDTMSDYEAVVSLLYDLVTLPDNGLEAVHHRPRASLLAEAQRLMERLGLSTEVAKKP